MKKIILILNLIIGIALFLYISYSFMHHTYDFHAIISTLNYCNILLACFLYMLSHLLRSIRLVLLVNSDTIKTRSLIRMQYYTNGINLALPFKLGEIYRIIELNKLTGDIIKSSLVIVSERLLDFLIIFALLLVCLLSFNVIGEFRNLYFLTFLFLVIVYMIFFLLPENISSIKLLLAKKYNLKMINKLLKIMDGFTILVKQTKNIYRKKFFTILLFTISIWALEILVFFILFSQFNYEILLFLGVLVFLSSLLPNGPIGVGGLQIAFYWISTLTSFDNYIESSLLYILVIFMPAVAVTILLYIDNFRRIILKK